MRILLIEDDLELAKELSKQLKQHGFIVEHSPDGEEGFYLAKVFPFDAVILDVNLPNMDGFEILSKLRTEGFQLPVLMLTTLSEVEDRVKGLSHGADDYLAKPFHFDELLARINAIIRRGKGAPSPRIEIADLVLDLNGRQVWRGEDAIRLSAREYNLLEYLALNQGKVIGRSELVEHIYDMNFDRDSNLIDVYIRYLRRKLDDDYSPKLIQGSLKVLHYFHCYNIRIRKVLSVLNQLNSQ